MEAGPGKAIAWRETRILEPKLRKAYVGNRGDLGRACRRGHRTLRVPGFVPGIRLCGHSQVLSGLRKLRKLPFGMWLRNSVNKTLAIRAFDDARQKTFVLSTTLSLVGSCFRRQYETIFVLSTTVGPPKMGRCSGGVRLLELVGHLIRFPVDPGFGYYLNDLERHLSGL